MSQLEGIQENLRRGLTEMLILCMLLEEDRYGYQLQIALKERTGGLFELTTASLYGPLYRLAAKGYIVEYVVVVGERRSRNYYQITDEGRSYYKLMVEEYIRTHRQVSKMVGLDKYGEDSYKASV